MRVSAGTVVAGRAHQEGATVTILASEDAETFELGPAEESALLEAIAEADRSDFVDASDVLAKLTPGVRRVRAALKVRAVAYHVTTLTQPDTEAIFAKHKETAEKGSVP